MKNEEKIYQKIKEASHKAEENSFPGMDKVWNRVEEKLDTKIIKKKSEVWKKLAIAASFLLFFTVGVQFYTTQKELTQPIEPVINFEKSKEKVESKEVITLDEKASEVEIITNSNSIKTESVSTNSRPKPIVSETIVESVQSNAPSNITKDKKISETAKTSFAAEEISSDVQLMSRKEALEKGYLNSASSKSNDFLSNRTIYAARSSNMKYEAPKEKNIEANENIETKSDDLVLINGKLSKKKKEDLNADEIEEMVELKNPIYIINGQEFSEESLFGEKPTSKYAPLNSQKIDSIKVYLPEEAKPIYGEKGKNGVVIISIKK